MADSPLAEQLLANNPWGFAARRGGSAAMPSARNLWAEAIAGAGAGGNLPGQRAAFSAPPIQPGREMPVAEMNPRMFGGGSPGMTPVSAGGGGGKDPGSIGPGLEKLGAGIAAGLKALKAKQDAAANQPNVTSLRSRLGPDGSVMPAPVASAPADISAPVGGNAVANALPLQAQPAVSPVMGAGTGVTSHGAGNWWTPERQQYAINYLKTNAGLSDHGAAGLVARWGFEAPNGPTDKNSIGGGHYGIAQWGQARGGPAAAGMTFDEQLGKATAELNGPEGTASKLLRNANDPESAARGATAFERAENYNPSTNTDTLTARTQAAIPGLMAHAPAPIAPMAPGILTAKDYDTAPPTPAGWTGTREQYIQSLKPQSSAAPVSSQPTPISSPQGDGLQERGAPAGISPADMKSLDQYQDMQQDASPGPLASNPLPIFAQGQDQSMTPLALALSQPDMMSGINPDMLAGLLANFGGGGGGLFG